MANNSNTPAVPANLRRMARNVQPGTTYILGKPYRPGAGQTAAAYAAVCAAVPATGTTLHNLCGAAGDPTWLGYAVSKGWVVPQPATKPTK